MGGIMIYLKLLFNRQIRNILIRLHEVNFSMLVMYLIGFVLNG